MGVVSRETALRAEVRAELERLRLDGREAVAAWMGKRGYATGHGDTIEDLLVELEGQLLRARETFGDGSAAEAARLRVMRIYASRLKRIADVADPARAALLRDMMFLDSARGRELCALLLAAEDGAGK